MNICDYIVQNDIPHKVMPDGRIQQVIRLDLSHNQITSLDGFVHNGVLDLCANKISSLDGFEQNGWLDLSHNRISSLDGFVQNGALSLCNNLITSLDGFVQNGWLDLSHNYISSLDNFTQTAYIDLSFNKIKSLDGFTPYTGTSTHLYGNSVYKIIIRIQQKEIVNNVLYCNGKFFHYKEKILLNVYTENVII
jgi:Leucine-rich repeat (LRR) protein